MKSRCWKIGCKNDHITLKFDRNLNISCAEVSVKFQSNVMSVILYLAASRFHKIWWSIHPSISFFRLGCCPCPILWVGSTRLYRTPVLHASLSCGSLAARPQILTSVFTLSDHVFLGLPHPLVLGIGRFVTDLIQDVARCTCPYHLSLRLRRTAVISSMLKFS